MTPQEMEHRLHTLEDLVDRWLNAYGQGCLEAGDDDDDPGPVADCKCIYCTTCRVLDGGTA